jgi:hypothetical protein
MVERQADSIVKAKWCTLVGIRMAPLKIRLDLLPAKKPRIEGPRPRANHGQAGPKHRQDERHPYVAGIGESNPCLDDGCHRSRQGCPQPGEKQNPRGGSEDFEYFDLNLMRHRYGGDSTIN